MTANPLKAPYPYFGGKSRAAPEIWRRFGRVANYVEPFFGSGAVLLGCPYPGHTETVNDLDGLLCNFWRALQADPDAVAAHADYPVSELDLHARHAWLVRRRADVTALLENPAYYDAQIAGWWVWGISQWIGSGWCPMPGAQGWNRDGSLWRKRPNVGMDNDDKGVHRISLASPARIADVGDLPRKIPHVGDAGRGLHRASEAHALTTYLRRLADRLRRTRIVCGDFARVLGPSVTWRHGLTAVLLDPPYDATQRAEVYAVESDAATRAHAWALENGDNPHLRIALCGYEGEHEMPESWPVYRWKTAGGYGSQGDGRGRDNADRECVWFSPHCLNDTPMEQWMRQQAAETLL